MQKEYKAKLLKAAKDYNQNLLGALEALDDYGFKVLVEDAPVYELIGAAKDLLDSELEPLSSIVTPNAEYYEKNQLASSIINGSGDWLTDEEREACYKNAEAMFALADNAGSMDEAAIKTRFNEIIGH